MRKRSDTIEGVVDRWDRNRVSPTVKKQKMGLIYRVKIDDQWYFFDTSDSPGDAQITSFFAALKPGASVRGGVYRKRGHNCISWIVGADGNIAPSNVLLWGLLCCAAFLLGIGSFKLLSMLMSAHVPDSSIVELLFVFGALPLWVILAPTAALGLLVAPFGIVNAFNPRKLRAMINYRREIASRALGVRR